MVNGKSFWNDKIKLVEEKLTDPLLPRRRADSHLRQLHGRPLPQARARGVHPPFSRRWERVLRNLWLYLDQGVERVRYVRLFSELVVTQRRWRRRVQRRAPAGRDRVPDRGGAWPQQRLGERLAAVGLSSAQCLSTARRSIVVLPLLVPTPIVAERERLSAKTRIPSCPSTRCVDQSCPVKASA